MNVRFIAGLLLAGIALSGNAGEPIAPQPSAAAHKDAVAEPVKAGIKSAEVVKVQFGTRMTNAVMVDISSRVADDLEARMTRALEVQQLPARPQHPDPLIVSRH